jgi:putative inorganic carbon (hco3(-)) transporter
VTLSRDAWRHAGLAALGFGALALGALSGVNPLLAIAGVLALTFAVAVFTDLAIGLAMFIAVTFSDILPVGDSPIVSAVKLAGAVLAIAWIALITTRRRPVPNLITEHGGLVVALVAFLCWAAASMVWAQDSHEALVATQRYGLNFLLIPIVFTAVETRRDLIWVIGAFIAGAVLSACFGLASPPDPTEDVARIEAAGLNANDLATVLVAGLVLALGIAAYARRSPLAQLIAVSAAILCASSLVLTLSRSGLVALGVALLATLLVASRRRGRAVAVAVLIASATVAYFAFVAPPEARERVTTFESDQGTGRVDIWTVGWRMVEDKPATGVGVGNFRITTSDYLLGTPGSIQRSDLIIDDPKVAHNVYLEALAELGVLGFLLFVAVIVLSVRETLRAARRFYEQGEPPMEALSRAVFAAQLGFLAAAFFASIEFNKQLWVLLALGPALSHLARVSDREAEGDRGLSA